MNQLERSFTTITATVDCDVLQILCALYSVAVVICQCFTGSRLRLTGK